MYDKQLIKAALTSNDEFINVLREKLKHHRVSISEFSKRSCIPLSSLNKFMKEKRDIRLSTLRQIIQGLQLLEKPEGEEPFIAIIAARSTLDQIKTRTVEVKSTVIPIREYPVTTIEEILKSAVRAELEGALAVVCAPVVSNDIKNLISIPITAMYIDEKHILDAVKLAASKAIIKTS